MMTIANFFKIGIAGYFIIYLFITYFTLGNLLKGGNLINFLQF